MSDNEIEDLEGPYKRQKLDDIQEPGYQLRNKCRIPDYFIKFKLYRYLNLEQQQFIQNIKSSDT